MVKKEKLKSIRRSKPIQQAKGVYQGFRRFAHLEASGGIVLIASAVIALIWANSPWSTQYYDLWHSEINFSFGEYSSTHDLHFWINEALMVIFFLLVGLEIKREVLVGELSSIRQAALPIAAAVGGMVVPASIYLLFNRGGSGSSGWGIPMATDIAFALGVMALVGSSVPIALKIFLTALAIVDDIGAVLIIAVFYTSNLSMFFLVAAGVIFVILVIVNVVGVRNIFVYSFLGICLWLAVLNSGLHATLAGVVLALTIPASRKINRDHFLQKAHEHINAFENAGEDNHRLLSSEQQDALISLETAVEDVEAPLQKMEHSLHPWVTFLIIPLFALANAGVSIRGNFSALLFNPISLGIIAGLILGKQIGVTLAAWIAVRLGFGELPAGILWRDIYAVGWLAGIGFTMSLFISELAFGSGEELEPAKVGILCASLLAGLIGFILLRWSVHSRRLNGQTASNRGSADNHVQQALSGLVRKHPISQDKDQAGN